MKQHKPSKMARIISFLAVCLFSIGIYAQTTVSGVITDSNGESLIGATVMIKGTGTGTITDIDGKYNISVNNAKATLVFSYLGYATEEVAVQNKTVINVTLKDNNNTLNDVVVVGYGVQKKKDLTGAVVNIKAEQLVAMPATQPAEALQGRIAGLDVSKGSGAAGSSVSIRIRGNRSVPSESKGQLTDHNKPLVIVDGMQGIELGDIAPSDILTIDVLKDAASSAIYGARGANGVIIVTTKSGQAGRAKLSVNSYYGISNVASYGKYMNTEQYVNYRIEQVRTATANETNGWVGEPKTINDVGFSPNQLARIEAGYDTYFPGLALQTGFQQEHTFNVNAGNDNTKVYLSGSIYDEQGVLKRDRYTTYSGRMNIEQKVYDWLNVGMRMQMTYSNRDQRHDPLNVARRIAPFEEYMNSDGTLILNPGNITGNANPLLDEDPNNWQNNTYGTRFSGSAYLEIKPLKGLSFRSNLGTSLNNSTNGTFSSENSIVTMTSSSRTWAEVSQSRSDYRRFSWENVLTYNNTFADIHNITFTGIAGLEKSINTGLSFGSRAPAVRTQLWHNPSASSENLTMSGSYREREYANWAARGNYILMDKYILNASIRGDASSKLNGNWAYFPSVGVAWRVSDENFIKESSVSNILSNLKLRGSFGTSGNDNVGDYIYQTELNRYTDFSWDGTQDLTYLPGDRIGNRNLDWERTATYDFGFDLGFINNRINVNFDYYNTHTTGLIADRALPPTAGSRKTYQNAGEVENKGYEILLETQNIANKNFRWNTTVTFAANREKILALPDGQTEIWLDRRLSRNLLKVGYPVEVAFGYIVDGIWQINEAEEAKKFNSKPGDLKFRDISGADNDGIPDGKISELDDMTVRGKMAPDWYGSINNDIQWKGFDLSVLMLFRYNFWVASDFVNRYQINGTNNVPAFDYWTPENPKGTYPRPGSGSLVETQAHSMTLTNNSYFKIKNVTLGYTIPQKITQRASLNRVRLWASAKNMIILQKDKQGFDPETVNNLGEMTTSQPLNKLLTFGLNVEF